MTQARNFARAVAVAAAFAGLAGCATTRPTTEVTRFHLGGPIASGLVLVEPADPARSGGLEAQSFAAEVERGWQGLGFTPTRDRARAEYVSTFDWASGARPGAAGGGSGVSIGIGGGGGYGGGVGLGGAITLPLGGRSDGVVAVNQLNVTLRRRSDSTAVWEGRAYLEASRRSPAGSLASAFPQLVDAVFREFPGPSGATVRYKPGT